MYNFTDLIAKSYLKYTKEKNVNIAVYFFQQYHLVNYDGKFLFTKSLFYNDLIKNLDGFIEGAFHNTHFIRRDHYYDNSIIEAEVFEEFQKKRLLEHQNLIDDSGIDYKVKRVNYEESINANELKEAFDYGLNLEDPVKIISPSATIQAEDLVLRKSKLEYIKTEAIRAKDSNSIEELCEEIKLDKNHHLKVGVISMDNPSNIEEVVKQHFRFTLDVDSRKKKQMLSEEDYLKIVNWVTYFLKNNYELPYIAAPIMELNISKTRIRTAFKKLIHRYHPRKPKPKSFYELVPKCFYALKYDTEKIIQKTSDPDKPVN